MQTTLNQRYTPEVMEALFDDSSSVYIKFYETVKENRDGTNTYKITIRHCDNHNPKYLLTAAEKKVLQKLKFKRLKAKSEENG